MNKEKKQEEEKKPKMRQIIIETDGNNINLIKAEISGTLELQAILSGLLNSIKNK